MIHLILRVLGIDDVSGPWYGFWSGFGSDLSELALVGALLGIIRRHNCRVRWCWRIGHHKLTDPDSGAERMLCWRHHPDVHHKNLTRARIAEIQERRHLYLGRKPGKG